MVWRKMMALLLSVVLLIGSTSGVVFAKEYQNLTESFIIEDNDCDLEVGAIDDELAESDVKKSNADDGIGKNPNGFMTAASTDYDWDMETDQNETDEDSYVTSKENAEAVADEIEDEFAILTEEDMVGASEYSGTCGPYANFEFNGVGSLQISGNGKMRDYKITDISDSYMYPFTDAPWTEYKVLIDSIYIKQGVTRIGSFAFCGVGGVSYVSISSSVQEIGRGAFWGCALLSDVVIPEGVTTIEASAFLYCTGLKKVTIPSSVESIAKNSFFHCENLTDIYYGGTEAQWKNLINALGEATDLDEKFQNAEVHYSGITLWEDGEEETGAVQKKIDSMTWSGGNYFWEKADGTVNGNYDTAYMKVVRVAETEEEKNANVVSVKLPDGFSFSGSEMVSEKEFDYQYDEGIVTKIYPIYSEKPKQDALFSVHLVFKNGEEIYAEEDYDGPKVLTNEENGRVIINETNYYCTSLEPNWFKDNSYKYNHSMAKLNAALSCMAYQSKADICQSYKNIGFSDVFIYEHGSTTDEVKDKDWVNYSFARKKVIVDGKVITIIVVSVRGTVAVEEWLSNVDYIGNEAYHEGFLEAKSHVNGNLNEYLYRSDINELSSDSAIKFMFSGHSRGAAVSNLLAADYINSSGLKPQDIYCYTFAAPNNTKDKNCADNKYDNIFNIIYPTDLVPYLPLRKWGFDKYGIILSLPDPLRSHNYAEQELAMGKIYKSFTGKECIPLRILNIAEAFASDLDQYVDDGQGGYKSISGKLTRKLGNAMGGLGYAEAFINLLADYSIRSVLEDGSLVCTHSMYSYLAWMDTISGMDDMNVNLQRIMAYVSPYTVDPRLVVNLLRVACPVDVEVQDSEGIIVAKVTDDTVDTSYTGIYAMCLEGVKYLYLPSSEAYDITITATDNGTMDYSIFEYGSSGGMVSRSVNAYGVEIEKGMTFQGTVDGVAGTPKENYQIRSSDGRTIIPDLVIDETKFRDVWDVEALIPYMITDENTIAIGPAGDTAVWTLDNDGVMIIRGTGSLYDYSYELDEQGNEITDIPWVQWTDGEESQENAEVTDFRGVIKSVVIEPEITYIGNNTFRGCWNLESVDLPESLTAVGDSAFESCGKLSEITIPQSVAIIGGAALRNCTSLMSVQFLGNAPLIGEDCFGGDTVTVYYPEGDTTWTAGIQDSFGGALIWQASVYAQAESISNATVTGIVDKEYNGSAQTQELTVKLGGRTLTEGTDYTLSYANNMNAGTATVTVTGKGNYTGTVSRNFTISQAAPTLKFETDSLTKAEDDAPFTNKLTAVTDGSVTYKSSDTAVAEVDKTSGNVTIKGVGVTEITATAAEGVNYKAGSAKYTLTVIENIAITSISLSETSISIVYGEERAVPSVSYSPESATDEKTVDWSSSNESIVTVSGDLIRAMDPGKAVITATVPGRNVSASADVRVLFTDVTNPGAWYFDSVYWALDNTVTSGMGQGTFQPTKKLTRAQTVTFLYNLAGKPNVSGLTATEFSDVAKGAWYYDAVKWAVANKITSGYGTGTFQPNAKCTRAMVVTFLQNYAKAEGFYKAPTTSADFKDVKTGDWFKESVDWAVENGITAGYGTGTFSPKVNCNRAMMVSFLKKIEGLVSVA